MTKKNSIRGKKSRAAGGRFELKVRKDLESKGWIVDKWSNNVEFGIIDEIKDLDLKNIPTKGNVTITAEKGKKVKVRNERHDGKLIPAKRKYNPWNKALTIGTGFPDFIAFKFSDMWRGLAIEETDTGNIYAPICLIGVESKSNCYLDKEEREKCKWLLDNNKFSKILIASKGEKRGEITYKEYGTL